MRIMDGVMAIPSILLAIAVVSLSGASIITVMIAITIPEIPRVARLVRSVVLSAREEPYVEAAISLGLQPAENHVAASVAEHDRAPDRAGHQFLRLRDPDRGDPVLPRRRHLARKRRPGATSWPRAAQYFQIKPSLIFWPGLLLSIAILSVNLIGDAARDALDPRMKQREGEVTQLTRHSEAAQQSDRRSNRIASLARNDDGGDD